MRKWLACAALMATAITGEARGQTCTTYPYTLTNGATADASQVMANFNCAALLGQTVAFGQLTEKLSLNSGSIGFNRAVTTGAIYNNSTYAFQFQHTSNANAAYDILALQVYNPSGGNVSPGALTVNGIGNVGVGTISPTTLLSLGPAVSGIKLAVYDGGASSLYGIGAQSGELTFGANLSATATPQMVLNNAGNVGIGTTAPGSDVNMAGGLTINGAASTQFSVQQNGTSGFAMNVSQGTWLMFDKVGGTWNWALSSSKGAVGVDGWAPSGYVFYSNGAAGGTSAWTNASDARLKQNVTEITGALDLVMRLRGVRFDWRPADKREVGKALPLAVGTPQLGFIAQEVQAVAPEAVVAPKDPTKDIYSLQETKLIPILVEAMKEQQAAITQQQAQIAKQQTEIEQLRADLAARGRP